MCNLICNNFTKNNPEVHKLELLSILYDQTAPDPLGGNQDS